MKRLSIAFILLISLSFAQESVVISPQSIVVNPKPSFSAEVWVDKDPSGNATPSYNIGENIRIGVKVSEDAYIYLFSIHANGVIDQILPNRYDNAGKSNYLKANRSKYFPHNDAPYTFSVDGPEGLDKVFVVASKKPLNTNQLANFETDPNFASSNIGQQGFAETLSIIVKPKEQSSWVTDTALFNVGRANTSRYGTIKIDSSPSGAAAYVDGQFVGYTPVRYGTTTGGHTVTVRFSARSFVTTVDLSSGETEQVNAR
ncbi:MAG TPA: DUF4384 domain-containing protein [Trueperaceae bacterium]|nr:DUF4384 domain-containing protein [Trueperaceae bacterium]